jgi:hypothetical protein
MENPEYLIPILLAGLLLLRLLVSFVNWISFPHLPKVVNGIPPGQLPKLSVLIPARNEEKSIGALLSDLREASYPNMEVLVFDDQSEDKTAEIIASFSEKDARFRLLQSLPLPEGWLGKNQACHQLAGKASGGLFLFLDADVRLQPDFPIHLTHWFQKKRLQLLSVFPEQIMLSVGEKKSVPVMHWILLSLLPVFLVRLSRKTSLSAANGQVMLFDANTYRLVQPHSLFRANPAEDIAIARFFKQKRLKTGLLIGRNDVSCRMYTSYESAIKGFSKNVLAFFGNSRTMAVAFVLHGPLTLLALTWWTGWPGFLMVLAAWILIRVFTSLAAGQDPGENLTRAFQQYRSLISMIRGAWKQQTLQSLTWKGRNIRVQP